MMQLSSRTPVEGGPFYDRGLSVFSDNMQLPRHRWYEFKEGFSAALVEEALDSVRSPWRPSHQVLDPFSGSGTTVVTAQSLGHSATGIEVNPFLAFAGTAKTATIRDVSEFLRFRDACLEVDLTGVASPLEGLSTFTERTGTSKWLFNLEVVRGVTAMQRVLGDTPPDVRRPLHLALLAAAVDCCNAKRDGKCLRYKKNWMARQFGWDDLRSAFIQRTDMMTEDLAAAVGTTPGSVNILNGDSRVQLALIPSGTVDVTVTSPPYLNSFDYSDVYRPEMFLGQFVTDNDELRRVRLRTVRSHVQVAWDKTSDCKVDLLRTYVSLLRDQAELWSRRLPDMVQAYFDDMSTVLRQLARVTKQGGQVWFVVSTSAYAGLEIPVDLILSEVGESAGLRLTDVHILRHLRSSGQHWVGRGKRPPLRESLIIWRKP